MTDDTKKIGDSSLLASTASTAGANKKGGVENIGKDEFLTMLVAQLKNQDPLDPMKSDQFAVNLAQFSQLEQLISINNKLDQSGDSDLSSLTGFLGHEVALDSNSIVVSNYDGGRLRLDLPSDASDVKVQLLNSDGSVKETRELGALSAGKHSIVLQGLQTESGVYEARVTAQSASGAALEPQVFAAGIVTGFVPGADPTLLLGDREVKPSEIKEVNVVK